MPSRTTNGSPRRPWTAYAVRGWRRDIEYFALSFVGLLLAKVIAPWGPYFVIGCTILVLSRRPDLRQRYHDSTRSRRSVHRMHAALWLCAIVGHDGRIPTVTRVESLAVGYRYQLHLPVGLHYELMEARAPELAAALSARDVQVRPCRENASLVNITEVIVDPFPHNLRSPLVGAESFDLWQPIPFAVADDGGMVRLSLPEHNLLLGGEPGSGKSVALSGIVAAAALDPTVAITLLDGKQVELAAWRQVANRFVGPNQDLAVEALEYLRATMDLRYEELLENAKRKIDQESDFGLHLVVIDELAFYLRGGKKSSRDEFAELLRDLVSRGRAAGIIVVAATQKPSHEVIPTWIRDLFAYRLAMRCSSSDASDTILGSGWAQRGFSAATIDPSTRGVGYLLSEGGVPVLLKTPFISDEEMMSIVQRALLIR